MYSYGAGLMQARRQLLLLGAALALSSPTLANETISYSYDALGRLVQVDRANGPNNGMRACYTLDQAGNRTAFGVGSGTCTGGGGTAPSFSVNNVSATEGGTLTFTITKSGTASGSTSVAWATAAGTATAGGDYTAPNPGTLTFTTSQTSQTVSVTTLQDTIVEGSETVFVNLSNSGGGATISDSQGVGTINDDDSAPICSGVSFSVANTGAVTEGANSGFTITRTGSSSNTCSVDFATASGTATTGADFTALSGTASFLPGGLASQSKNVVTIDDTTVEGSESFTLSLTNPSPGATIGTTSATGTINDNDSAGGACSGASFSVNDVTVTEGTPLNFIVSKTGTTSNSCSISYATADGTAFAGTHYTAKSGTLTFSASQTTQTLSVTTIDLMRITGNKVMYLNLSNATLGAGISDAQGKGTIGPSDDGCITCLQSPPPGEPADEPHQPEETPE